MRLELEKAAETLFALRGIAMSHALNARMIGNLRAADLIRAIDWLGIYENGQLNEACGICPPEDHRAISNDMDEAAPALVLCYLHACASGWEPGAAIIGPITGGRIVEAVGALLKNGEREFLVGAGEGQPGNPPADPVKRLNWRDAAEGKRRFSAPRPRPGELKVQWGTLAEDGPDLVAAGGDGTARVDRALLFHAFTAPRWAGPLSRNAWEPSLMEELVMRGYDPETFRFSIRKKA